MGQKKWVVETRLTSKQKERLDSFRPDLSDADKIQYLIEEFFRAGLDAKDELAVILDREFGGVDNDWTIGQVLCPECHEVLVFGYTVKNLESAQRWRSKLYHLFSGQMFIDEIKLDPWKDKLTPRLQGFMQDKCCPNCECEFLVIDANVDNEYYYYKPMKRDAVRKQIVDAVCKPLMDIVNEKIRPDEPRFTDPLLYEYYLSEIKDHLKRRIENKIPSDPYSRIIPRQWATSVAESIFSEWQEILGHEPVETLWPFNPEKISRNTYYILDSQRRERRNGSQSETS